MHEKTKGIVLNQFKYSDTSIIIHVYTEKFGRLNFIVRRTKRKTQNHIGLLQPLFLLDMEITYRPQRSIQQLRHFSCAPPLTTIPFEVSKSSVAIFLAEVLYKILREEEENASLFGFLYNSILFFDVLHENTPNFHLFFLANLTKHLGFYPINNYTETNKYFDLFEAQFSDTQPLQHYCEEYLGKWINLLFASNVKDVASAKIENRYRSSLLSKIMEFYKLHIEDFGQPKSLEILRAVFS